MVKLPYTKYIYFLLVLHRFDQKKINEILDKSERLLPTGEQYAQFKKYLTETIPISKETKKLLLGKTNKIENKAEFESYLRKLGIYELFANRYKIEEHKKCSVCEMLFLEKDFYPELQAFIFKAFTNYEIINFFKDKHNIELLISDLDYYRDIFLPIFALSRDEWKDYIKAVKKREQAFLITALKKDPHYLRLDTGAETKVQYSNILQFFMASSFRKFQETMNLDSSEARNWARLTMNAGDRKQKLTPSDANQFLKDVQMAFDFEENQMPSIDELD